MNNKDILKDNQRILLIRNTKIGDMVVTTTLFHNLKLNFKNITLDVLASNRNDFILKYDQNINNIYINHRESKTKTFIELLKLRKNKYDVVIDLTRVNFLRSIFFKFMINSKKNIGFSKVKKYIIPQNFIYDEIVQYDINNTVIENLLKIITLTKQNVIKEKKYMLFNSTEIENKAKEYIDQHNKKFNIILNISTSSTKRDINICLLKRILDSLNCFNNRINIIITCMPNRRKEVINFLNNHTFSNVSLSYETKSIFDIMALIKYSNLVITPDTSVIHIASSYEKDIIGLYNLHNNNFSQWKPLGKDNLILFSNDFDTLDNINIDKIIPYLDSVLNDKVFKYD